jgi:hypothetical protein
MQAITIDNTDEILHKEVYVTVDVKIGIANFTHNGGLINFRTVSIKMITPEGTRELSMKCSFFHLLTLFSSPGSGAATFSGAAGEFASPTSPV